jgi:hypothetical protein
MRTCLVRGREAEGRFWLIRMSRNTSRVRLTNPPDSESELVPSEFVDDVQEDRPQALAHGGERDVPALEEFAGAPQLYGKGCRIFAGTCGIVDHWLRIDDAWVGEPPRYKNRTNMLLLAEHPPADLDGVALVRALRKKVNDNWNAAGRPVPRSRQNWRFTKMLAIDPSNPSREKRIEKAIVLATDDSWANQIPTASGLVDSQGRQCNVDLAKRQGSEYWLFELKCESDHPISAAMQILRYGVLYLFWREHLEALAADFQRQPLLGATRVHLRVLAPKAYYAVPDLEQPFAWLEELLSVGIRAVSTEQGIEMDFGFDVLQETLYLPMYPA